MAKRLKYVPVFRVLQEESKVLKSFSFEEEIYPCIEIVREIDRAPIPNKKTNAVKVKKFEEIYLPLINSIKSPKVFVDLPLNIEYTGKRNIKKDVISFIKTVIENRTKRTEYLKKLSILSSKIIPVISTYFNITGEPNSITLQAKDLRDTFSILAFRTYLKSISNDIPQIKSVLKPEDYLIMDWGDQALNLADEDQLAALELLKEVDCTIIIHRNAVPKGFTNVGLIHEKLIEEIDNSIVSKYKEWNGDCFSDYIGIKKHDLTDGGAVSPGFIYYDAVNNEFYGFRFEHGGHKKNETRPKLIEFESRIVPSIIKSDATRRMQNSEIDYLSDENPGWAKILNINHGDESGKSAAKFKRIGIEHYLHCIKLRIGNGDFD